MRNAIEQILGEIEAGRFREAGALIEGPSYPYKTCTSLFFRDNSWLSGAPIPAEQRTSIGPSCSQAIRE
jgi:hypothetical protein